MGHSSGDMSGSSDMSPSVIEGMLLMAVEKLYKEDRELDVQIGLLRVVLQVLQRHGQSLPLPASPAVVLWSIILSLDDACVLISVVCVMLLWG